MNSLLTSLHSSECWEKFYKYKTSGIRASYDKQLKAFIDNRRYLSVCPSASAPFPIPKRAVISKQGKAKKRIVYTYPEPENTVLKLLTHLMLRKYDHLFCPLLYSFRPQKTAKDAVRKLMRTPDIGKMYSYKVDISNYFNSVPIEPLVEQLNAVLVDDPQLFEFLKMLLTDGRALYRGETLYEQRGIMAGTPISSFFANLYLRELDEYFYERGIPYARYSDDIIVFAPSFEEIKEYKAVILDYLKSRSLSVNPDKECLRSPDEGFVFLGFSVNGPDVDIAPATVDKLKDKMRRKTRALKRWSKRNGVSGEKAAAAFIRVFNRKLLEAPEGSELSWGYWFFSVINTTNSLSVIDAYAADCIRYLISGTHTKARFNVRYDALKALGYRSLVHEYYAHKCDKSSVQ